MATYNGGDCVAEAVGTVWKRPVLWSGLGLVTLLPGFLDTLGGTPKPDVAGSGGILWKVDLPGVVVSRTNPDDLLQALRAMVTPSLSLRLALFAILVSAAYLVLYKAALMDRTGNEVRLDRLPVDLLSLLRVLVVLGGGLVVLVPFLGAGVRMGVPNGLMFVAFLSLLILALLRLPLAVVLVADGSTIPEALRRSWRGLRGHMLFVAGIWVRLLIIGLVLAIPTLGLSWLAGHQHLPSSVVPVINLVFKAPYQAVVALALAAMTREFVKLPEDPPGALVERPA